MSKVLFVNACVREHSRTLKLARFVLKKLGQEVDEVRVFDTALYPLDAQRMAVRDAFCASKDFAHPMFDLGKQFAQAEIIVVAAPYWDLMFPASLKSYLETITVNDLTFTYDEHGHPISLCNGKKLIFVTTSGGPIHFNFGFDYLSAMAKIFFGIKDVKCIKAECLDIQGADVEGILNQVKESLLTTTL